MMIKKTYSKPLPTVLCEISGEKKKEMRDDRGQSRQTLMPCPPVRTGGSSPTTSLQFQKKEKDKKEERERPGDPLLQSCKELHILPASSKEVDSPGGKRGGSPKISMRG